MTGAIIHRGPDDEGFFTSGPVGLGFRRLSIIDLAGGHQPLCNEDKTVMVVTSASSTPLLAFIAVILGILMWPLRGKMRAIRWGLALLLIGLHLVMKAPVWFLINHIDFVSGNSGYHRALLIDMCVKHFWDWWLIGVKSTQN